MHNMIDERLKIEALDNNSYPEILWTRVKGVLSKYQDDNYLTKIDIQLT